MDEVEETKDRLVMWPVYLIFAIIVIGSLPFAVWFNGFEKTKATMFDSQVEVCEIHPPIVLLLEEYPGSKADWNNPGLFEDLECLIETPKGQRFYTDYPY